MYTYTPPNDRYLEGFFCNICFKKQVFPSFQCVTCEYDVCTGCWNAQLSKVANESSFSFGSGLSPVSFGSGVSSVSFGSLKDMVNSINAVAKPLGFQCVPVSWEDATRSKVNGVLSSMGPNISDVRLW